MVDEQRSSELGSGPEDQSLEGRPFVTKGETLAMLETQQATTEPSVAEAIIDAGRNRALELANLFAAQAGHSANLSTETAKRKRDDSSAIEAPENKRPAGDITCLKFADDQAFAPTTAALLVMDGNASETLLCPPDKVGRIIGRAGATIRDLEASTSTRIQVDHKAIGDKPVVISGRRDDVERAKRSVQDLISGASDSLPPSSGEVQETVECPPGIVGRVIGRGGETIRTLQQASGAHILVNQEFPDGVPRHIVITGTQDAVQRATSMVSELINGDHTSTQTVIQRFGVGSTEVVECPKAMVGRIIGKGGETIKDLQKRFNASIQIDQGSTPCKVTITGPGHAILSARRAIEDLVRTTIPQPSGGTRSGPSYNTSYAHPPYNVATGPYIPYGSFGMAAATYPTPSSYQPYAGYSSYPSTLPPFGSYGGFGAAAPDPYGSSVNYGHQHYASTGTSQQNAGTTAHPPGTSACPWQVLQDDQGRNYYYNSQTGVSQWEKPADMP
nr:C1, subunit of the circadian RNA-binding protein CHLAMY1 [Volvox reticuliferus]